MNSDKYIQSGVRRLVAEINDESSSALVKIMYYEISNNRNPMEPIKNMLNFKDDVKCKAHFSTVFDIDEIYRVIDSDLEFIERINERNILSGRSCDSAKVKLNEFMREFYSELNNLLSSIAQKTMALHLNQSLSLSKVFKIYQKEVFDA